MDKHNCDNVNCNHNNTKGLCCLFNPENCKYRQLQKENKELKKACDETQELLDKQIEATYKLDKENAELKEKYDTRLRENTGLKIHNAYVEKKLTKAKEIIKKLKALYLSPVVTNDDVKRQDKILEEAEQFIKE